jgi:DNA-binding NarL/FixJ family response regulator
LVDDNAEMCKKVEKLLELRFEVIGSVADGQQAIESASSLNPDFLVSDISMPILNGIQMASQLRDLGCTTKVIFVTVHDDDDYRVAASSIGAAGYVLKARIDTDLIPAIEMVLRKTRT